MIQNERQHKITQTKLRELEKDLAQLDLPDPSLHPRKILARRNSLNILIAELQQEIAEYEQLRSGQVTQFALNSIQELPTVMIKARIATGLTQKDLAEKIGVQEQQIQRYEANNYHAIAFDRLQEVLQALKINFAQAVMQINIDNNDAPIQQQSILNRIVELLPQLSIEQLGQKVDELREQGSTERVSPEVASGTRPALEDAAIQLAIWLEEIATGRSLQWVSSADVRQSETNTNELTNRELQRLAYKLFTSK
jgi:HTH-type transcriptional regulator / antitoxin HipB